MYQFCLFFKLSAFLRYFFLCQDRWHGDVPPYLAPPCYVALGRALDSGLTPMFGLCSSAMRMRKQYGAFFVHHPLPGFKPGSPRLRLDVRKLMLSTAWLWDPLWCVSYFPSTFSLFQLIYWFYLSGRSVIVYGLHCKHARVDLSKHWNAS